MKNTHLIIQFGLVLLVNWLMVSPAFSGDAVSQTNGRIEALGGNINGDDGSILAGSITFPVTTKFGIQLDAVSGDLGGNDLSGGSFHAFWRDSDTGLFGLTGTYAVYDNNDIKRGGFEAEYYFDNITLMGGLGYQDTDGNSGGYGSLDLRYYPNKNLMLQIGISQTDGDGLAHLSAEYQPEYMELSGLTFYLDSANGEHDFDYTIGGIKYYFGANKSLKRRHREDDPSNLIISSFNNSFSKPFKSALAPQSISSGSNYVINPSNSDNTPTVIDEPISGNESVIINGNPIIINAPINTSESITIISAGSVTINAPISSGKDITITGNNITLDTVNVGGTLYINTSGGVSHSNDGTTSINSGNITLFNGNNL